MHHGTPRPRLTARQMGRYQRQMVLPEVGIDGQSRLLESRVLVVGAGALGSAAATYLAAAGVGTIGLVDGDTVEMSNLHRQILHDESQIGQLKTHSGAQRLMTLNPDVRVQEHPEFLLSDNVLRVFSDYDLIVNGSDNFPTRYLVNDAAVLLNKPLVDAAILRFEGHLAVFTPGTGCYRCLFPTPPPPGTVPDCAEAGIFGAVAGVLGSMQAVEALKILLNLDRSSSSRLLVYEALTSSWQRMPFHRDSDCVVCGDHPTVIEPIDYENFCGIASPAGRAVEPGQGTDEFSVSVEQAHSLLSNPRLVVLDVRQPEEFATGHMASAIHCPLEDLDRLASSDQIGVNTPLLVVCAAGVRSGLAVKYLRSREFEAFTLTGGIRAWQDAGHHVVT